MGAILCGSFEKESETTMATTVQTQPAAQQYEASVDAAIQRLKELKINFLAVDFDCTILSIHTGGRWHGTHQELLQHVRPYFPPLLERALKERISVAIVTFSPQVDLVRSVLDSHLGHEASRKIPIRAGGQFSYNGGGMRDGKQAHMASAVEELETTGVEITKATSLLIDDDGKNVRTALRDGVRAIWLNPDQPDQLLTDIARLV
mmetsp:Transcript_24557/g.44409  ORF Transcript_24557/g.44409 Transcript_24557/m.44409 type:complete len:205 (+) Transcript_24557:82-696(+)